MVGEIRIYVEGGGESRRLQSPLREAFGAFFREPIDRARLQEIRWYLVACGSRSDTFSDFMKALESHPDAFNLLLIDSEEPIMPKQGKWDHLKQRDNWTAPKIDDEHCHFMVCMMEAWIVADVDALTKYYGQGFSANSIPGNKNVEEIPKQILVTSLKNATRHTKTKGEYEKARDAPHLIRKLDAVKVREAAPHCERLFNTLLTLIGDVGSPRIP